MRYWEMLQSDPGAFFDSEIRLDGANLPPIVSWGTSPEDVISVEGLVPDPDQIEDEVKRGAKKRALAYMGLTAGTKITDIKVDRIFIGPAPMGASRTCGRRPRCSPATR